MKTSSTAAAVSTAGSSPHWREVLLRALLLFLVWRCSLFLFDFIGLSLSGERMANSNKDWQAFAGHYFFDGFFRWDGGWYSRIAENGYYLSKGQSNVAFFPLYPYLSRYLGHLVGGHYMAGWLISNISCVLGLAYLYRIGVEFFDEQVAQRACVFLLIFPTSLFLSAYYTEGLFLFTGVASTYYFMRGRYVLCGAFGLLAMLTRSSGMALFVAFSLVLAWRLFKRSERFDESMLAVGLIPCGLLIFMLVLSIQVGDGLAFLDAQSSWGRTRRFPLFTLYDEITRIDWAFPRDSGNIQRLLDVTSGVGFLGIAYGMWRKRFPAVLILIVVLGVLVPASTGKFMSMMRFCLTLFPAFLYLGVVCRERPRLEMFLVYLFSFFLGIYSLRYMNWQWAG